MDGRMGGWYLIFTTTVSERKILGSGWLLRWGEMEHARWIWPFIQLVLCCCQYRPDYAVFATMTCD